MRRLRYLFESSRYKVNWGRLNFTHKVPSWSPRFLEFSGRKRECPREVSWNFAICSTSWATASREDSNLILFNVATKYRSYNRVERHFWVKWGEESNLRLCNMLYHLSLIKMWVDLCKKLYVRRVKWKYPVVAFYGDSNLRSTDFAVI